MATRTRAPIAKVSRFPRRCGPVPGAGLVDAQLLAVVGFSDHAIQRFAERTGIRERGRHAVEPLARDLLRQEGLRVPRRPNWAGSRQAPFYLQVGEWLLFVGRKDTRGGRILLTTVIAHEDWTWTEALAHGEVGTPPPLRAEPRPAAGLGLGGIARALVGREHTGGVLARVRRARRDAQLAQAAVLAAYAAERREHDAARAAAHRRHLARHGFIDG